MPVPLWAAPSPTAAPEHDLGIVRQAIDAIKKEIRRKEASRDDAADALKASEKAISDANRVLNQLAKQKAVSQAEKAQAEQNIAQARQDIDQSRKRIGRLIASQYRTDGSHDALKMLLNQEDPNQAARDLAYYTYIAKSQQSIVDKLRVQLSEMEALSAHLAEEDARLQKIADEQLQQKQKLEAEKSRKQAVLSQLSEQIHSQNQQVSKLQADEKRLTAVIDQINREVEKRRLEEARKRAEAKKKAAELAAKREAERKAAERQAKEAARKEYEAQKKEYEAKRREYDAKRKALEAKQKSEDKTRQSEAKNRKPEPLDLPPPPTPPVEKKPEKIAPPPKEKVPDDDLPDPAQTGKSLAALKGRMKLPIHGEITGQFGTPRGEGGQWKGVFIKAPAGQKAKVIADGRVVYADWLRGFGNLIIVDHGANYMSVYANAESLLKQVGDKVRAGEGIATTGSTGGVGGSGLYFELRHLGKPLNPQGWVG